MTDCDRIRRDAPGLAALAPDDPERSAAVAHARTCAGCGRALREAERLQSLLAAVEPEPLPTGALERVSGELRAALRRGERRRVGWSIAATCAAVAVLVGFARARSPSPADWALAAALAALAVLLVAAAGRRPPLATALAVAAALGAATVSGAAGPLAPSLGLECLATELGAAALVAGAGWAALRDRTGSAARAVVTAAAAAGALAGDAALQVTCAAHTSAPHLLAFHVGGVLLAAAGARAAFRPLRRAARP